MRVASLNRGGTFLTTSHDTNGTLNSSHAEGYAVGMSRRYSRFRWPSTQI
jgi:hypothetical protein